MVVRRPQRSCPLPARRARGLSAARGAALTAGAAGGGQVTYLRGFYADERIMAYVRAGHLMLQPWTDLAECAGPPHIKCWQTMVYSHAALDAWGSGTAYLLYADPDEYLVFPNQAAVGSVGDVLRWCTNDAAQARAARAPGCAPRAPCCAARWRCSLHLSALARARSPGGAFDPGTSGRLPRQRTHALGRAASLCMHASLRSAWLPGVCAAARVLGAGRGNQQARAGGAAAAAARTGLRKGAGSHGDHL